MKWSETSHALTALFLIALAESSVFPIPPDVLLITIVAAKPTRWLFATVTCLIGSIVGAAFGYGIGYGLMVTVGQPIIDFYGAHQHWDQVVRLYNGPVGLWFLAIATFTPIPFKVATIAAGSTSMPIGQFLLISFIGRGARFSLVAITIRLFGAHIRSVLERYFDFFAGLFLILLLGGFLALKLFY